MNENLEFDYTVTKKAEGKYLLARISVVAAYVIFGLVFFFGLYLLHLYQFIAFIVLVEWILVFFTWRYVSVEYRYETVSGSIRFFTVYGGKKRKLMLETRIKDFTEIRPYTADLDGRKFAEQINCLSSERSSPDRYCAVYLNREGKECAVCFEATQKALKILRFYNSATVITDTRY